VTGPPLAHDEARPDGGGARRLFRPADWPGPEPENFAWIDFLWSTPVRSGQVGTDMGLIYADPTSTRDTDALEAVLGVAVYEEVAAGAEQHHGPDAEDAEALPRGEHVAGLLAALGD
jgi:hypothetical protein